MLFPTERSRRRRASVLAGVVALVCAVALAACGSSADKGSSGGGSTSAKAKHVSIGMEMALSAIPYYQRVQQGAEAAAQADGAISLDVQAPPGVDPTTGQQQARAMLAKGPDAMGIAPFPPELWGATMKAIVDQVPNTLAWNIKPVSNAAQAASSPIKTYLGSDDRQIARAVAFKTIEVAKLGPDTTGTALVGQCVPGNSGVLADLDAGFVQAVAQRLPKVKIVRFDSKPDPSANVEAWQTAFRQYPDVVLTFGPCDQDTTSVLQLKRRDPSLRFASAISTPSLDALQGIHDGVLTASAFTGSYELGYLTVELLADAARGKPLPQGWIDVGYTVATKQNADAIEAGFRPATAAAYYRPRIEQVLRELDQRVHPLADSFK